MKKNESLIATIQLKAYSKKEIAQLYEISTKSLQTWLIPFEKELGPRVGRFYNPKQMKIIFEKLGIPETVYFK
jgi:hypothetical protein